MVEWLREVYRAMVMVIINEDFLDQDNDAHKTRYVVIFTII